MVGGFRSRLSYDLGILGLIFLVHIIQFVGVSVASAVSPHAVRGGGPVTSPRTKGTV